MFWILTLALSLLAALFVLLPLWLRSRSVNMESSELRKKTNIDLFNERSSELEGELSEGNLEHAQFDSLMQELQQGLLADVEHDEKNQFESGSSSAGQSTARSGGKWRLVIPVLLVLLTPALAYSLYNEWGYIEDVELMDLFQRTVNNTGDTEEAQSLIVSLGEAVQEDQDKPWAWYFLAENFANIGMFAEAEIAYRQASLRLEGPEKSLVLGRVALAMYVNADLQFTADILEVVEQARAINPNEISILQLLAADAEQREDYPKAIEYWRLLIQVNPNSGQARELRQSIAAAQRLMNGDELAAVDGPEIDVNVSLAEGIDIDPSLRVFVAARNAAREGLPPLAAVDLTVADLPATIRLDNSAAVGPFNLSSADTIYISALISFNGSATQQPGDFREVSQNFSHNGQHAVIELVIDDRLP